MEKNIKKIFKIINKIILIIILLIICVGYYFYQKEQKKEKQSEKVIMTIKYDLYNCEKEYPLFVTISNNSNKIINFIEYSISIYEKGYSTDISTFNKYSSDRIITPGMTYNQCIKNPFNQIEQTILMGENINIHSEHRKSLTLEEIVNKYKPVDINKLNYNIKWKNIIFNN